LPALFLQELRSQAGKFACFDHSMAADPLHPSTRPNVSDGSVPCAAHRYKPPYPTQALVPTWKKHSTACLMKWWGNFLFPGWRIFSYSALVWICNPDPWVDVSHIPYLSLLQKS